MTNPPVELMGASQVLQGDGKATAGLRSFLGSQIRMAREESGLSLSQAAGFAGITKSHLHDLETGRSNNPTVKVLWGLGFALNCRPADLLNAAIRDRLNSVSPTNKD